MSGDPDRTFSKQALGSLLGKLGWQDRSVGDLWPPLERYCPVVPSARQLWFLLANDREVLYGGAAGGGKTAALLMAALQYVDKPGYAALILRRTYPQLTQPGNLIPLSKEWLGTSDAKWNEQLKTWQFPAGSTLTFGHVQDEQAVFNYQGGAYQFVGFDELTQFSETQFTYIAFSRQRRNLKMELMGVPIRTRSTSNPGGVGHAWVKNRYLDRPAVGAIFIPAKVKDNPGLDVKDYAESLGHLPETLRQQLLEGDWGAFEGQAFQDWNEADHCVPAFLVPVEWDRFESMDYGISNPTCWLAWAVDFEGNHLIYDYLYEPALPSESAPKVLKKRQGWRSTTCFGDPMSLAQRTSTLNSWGDPLTIETEFSELGVPIVRANNNPRAGYTRVRELLKLDPAHRFPDWHPRRGEPGSPRLFVVKAAVPELADQVAAAPLQPIEKRYAGEQVDSEWEGRYGHAIAALRYGAMSRADPSERVEARPSNPAWTQDQRLRAEIMWEMKKKRDERDHQAGVISEEDDREWRNRPDQPRAYEW